MSRVSLPNPSAPPPSPMVDEEARRQRQIAENQALAESKSAGRGATIIAGREIANSMQAARGAARKARQASEDLL